MKSTNLSEKKTDKMRGIERLKEEEKILTPGIERGPTDDKHMDRSNDGHRDAHPSLERVTPGPERTAKCKPSRRLRKINTDAGQPASVEAQTAGPQLAQPRKKGDESRAIAGGNGSTKGIDIDSPRPILTSSRPQRVNRWSKRSNAIRV